MTLCHLRYVTPGMEHTAAIRQAPKHISLEDARAQLRGLWRDFQRQGYTVKPLRYSEEGFEAICGDECVSVYIHVAQVRMQPAQAQEMEWAS